MGRITVNHVAGDAFHIDVRGHCLVVDQQSLRRDERGPAPVELFVAGLAGCAATAAMAYLRRHRQEHDGLRVECDWLMRPDMPRVMGSVRLRVLLPIEPDAVTYDGVVAAVHRSTVNETLAGNTPGILVEVYSFPEWATIVRRQEFEDDYVLA